MVSLSSRDIAASLHNRAEYFRTAEGGWRDDSADLLDCGADEIKRLIDVIRSRDKHIKELQDQLFPAFEAMRPFIDKARYAVNSHNLLPMASVSFADCERLLALSVPSPEEV